MNFKGFYPRVTLVLIITSLALFLILSVFATYYFRTSVDIIMVELERPRMNRIFAELDRRFGKEVNPDAVHQYLETLFFEFNLNLYNRADSLITAINTPHLTWGPENHLRRDGRLTGFSAIYYNPNPDSPFRAMKVDITLPGKPILKRMLLLLLAFSLVVIAVFSFVGWQMVSRLNRRLERLKAGVGQIAAGNFDVQLDDSGEDEIAFLARNFNLMSTRLKNLVQNLKESNAVRQRLFAHASHEIKSPLTSIKGFVDIIEFTNVLPEDQGKDLLPAVKKDLNRVIKITNDMLQLARLRDPAYRLECRKFDFVELIREEHSFFAKKAGAQSVQADLVIDPDGPVVLETDPDRISQILDNLWSNALKYGDPAGAIRTELVLHNQFLRITISNRLKTPLNVPVSRLFEPFYRNPADADKVLGSGLGLVIVKELVEKLGGAIDAELRHPWIAVRIRFPREMCGDV